MRKNWTLLLIAAFGMVALTACEDVPAPYNIPTENGENATSEDYVLLQSFATSLGECATVSEAGALAWEYSSQYKCALITGYKDFDGSGNKMNQSGTTWLVSPEIDLTGIDSAYVSIEHAINYAKTTVADDHKLFISTDYVDSLGVGAATWTDLQMSTDGLGSSFTFNTTKVQIDQSYIGQTVRLALKHVAHDSYSSTWEVKSLNVVKGAVPAPPSLDDLVGTGTADDPYDVASTLRLIAANPPAEKIYTKGIVSAVDASSFDASYGSLIYQISDDGTTSNQLQVYRGFGLKGAKFASADALQVGDSVIVFGQAVYYNNQTMQFTTGSQLYMHNGDDGTPIITIKGSRVNAVTEGGNKLTFSGFSTKKFQIYNEYSDSTTSSTQLRITSIQVNFADASSQTVNPKDDFALSGVAELSAYTVGDLTLTFAIGNGISAPKYYTAAGNAARLFDNNTLLIQSGKDITSVIVNTTASYTGNSQLHGIVGN